MLSTNPSSITNRRQLHRRQNSTPVAFEGPNLRSRPATVYNQRIAHSHRRGMSLDQRQSFQGYNFHEDQALSGPGTISQADNQVSMTTNPGPTPSQHDTQVAQQHGPAQPGQYQHELEQHPQSAIHPNPTYYFGNMHNLNTEPPNNPSRPSSAGDDDHRPASEHSSPVDAGQVLLPLSPNMQLPPPENVMADFSAPPTGVAPSEQQIRDLQEHIRSVYGGLGTVFVNILPSPVAAPQKGGPVEPLEMSPLLINNANGLEPLNFGQPLGGLAMNNQLGSDQGFDASTGYHTPSGMGHISQHSSPRQRHLNTFLDSVEEMPIVGTGQQLDFFEANQLLSSPLTRNLSQSSYLSVSHAQSSPRAMSIADLHIDGTIEETGITSEEISKYISEQDPQSHRWTCLYPGCDKKFGRRENIRSHVQTHLGDRQYRCRHCGKCFVRQHDLKRHAKIHSGDKPFVCPCGGGFARQDALTRHRQRGMCVGGFPGATRSAKARGRPRKNNRPDMEDRMEKAARSRRNLTRVNYAGSISGESMTEGSEEALSPFNGGMDDLGDFNTSPIVGMTNALEDDLFGLHHDHVSAHSPDSGVDQSSPYELLEADAGGNVSADAIAASLALQHHTTGEVDVEETLLASLAGLAERPVQTGPDSCIAGQNGLNATLAHDNASGMAHTPPHSPQVEDPESAAGKKGTLVQLNTAFGDLPTATSSPSHISANSRGSHAFTTPPTSPLTNSDDAWADLGPNVDSDPFVGCVDSSAMCHNPGVLNMSLSMFDNNAFSIGMAGDAQPAIMSTQQDWLQDGF